MRCPFLKEANVRYCLAAPFRKMILEAPESSAEERCSSPSYVGCPSAPRGGKSVQPAAQCPSLQTALVQYCSAAAVTRYIPYSESLQSRCGIDSHRYCEVYLGVAHPPEPAAGTSFSRGQGRGPEWEEYVEDVHVPHGLAYSPNHMWLDVSEDGSCHIGVDAFFTRVIGQADRLSFVPARGAARPSAVFSVSGVDMQMIFPKPMLVTRTNDYLRANPGKLAAHPYSFGWLFEGEIRRDVPGAKEAMFAGLFRGRAALDWMRRELERISVFVHERCSVTGFLGESLSMDGGTVRTGGVRHLSREETFALFNEFFAFYTTWRNQQC